ncbi:Low temperature-induced protein [Nostoc sp. DSM 114160]|jgi:ABC-type Na+ efflux pump permease subunit
MQKILLSLKQVLRSSFLVISLMVFIGLSGSFILVQQTSHATTLEELKLIPPEYKPNSEEKINRANEYDPGVGIQEEDRQKAYEQAKKDSKNLNTIEKTYERNLKAEQKQNPPESFGEKAKEVIEKVTGK